LLGFPVGGLPLLPQLLFEFEPGLMIRHL
jgi:hypothetical protein